MRTAEQMSGDGLRRPESSPLVPLVERVESAASLDPVAERLAWIINPLLSAQQVRDLLRGAWLGHAVHPLLTDLPLGAWTCTSLVDLFGGRQARPAAEGLLAFGLAAAIPTALTGAAEWGTTRGGDRRVGVVHAGINMAAAGLYGSSLLARRHGRHGLGVALGLAGGLAAIVSGYLGGHLAIGRKVGTSDPAFHAPAGRPNPTGQPGMPPTEAS